MPFELFDAGEVVGKVMPDGMYLVIVDQPIYKVDIFDMNKTFVCDEVDISVYSGKKLQDIEHKDRGLWKVCTAANVLVFCGEEEGFPVYSNVIYQEDERGNRVHGLLIGTLNTQPKEIRHKIISCVNNDMGHITKEMWYLYDKKGPPMTEQQERQGASQKRKLSAFMSESKGET